MSYRCYAPEYADEEDAMECFAPTPQYAAEEFHAEKHFNFDYPSELEIIVIAEDGTRKKFRSVAEQVVEYHAKEVT